MTRLIYNFVALVSGINAFMLFNLGYDWINFGYGLNPWIALPLAFLFIFAAWIARRMAILHTDLPLAHPIESDWDEFVDAARAARQEKLAGINRSNEYITEEAFRRLNSTEY